MVPETGIALLDFYADWCGPCKSMEPSLKRIEPALEAKDIKLVKINIDENRELAMKYGVRGVPTFILVNNGEETGRKVGVVMEGDMRDFVGV